ncbi:PadR family transcriptional regulator [Streptomyces sp. BV286]|uniref:PadR family transcriptional regulator n=1 Tax=Streptomyces sp. BV286 TaxID=2849672 RepID=UPI001C2EB14A|nr:helix-turn-helix transcriptional regulator [Streptomyces sp. BV286]MBV1940892.1 PadR family transcriptional regulator [Streptomyces sp. BV286]
MDVQITRNVARVLRVFTEDAGSPHFGMELMKSLHMSSGTLYPILIRLSKAGWIDAHDEDVDPSTVGRPARRYYTITGEQAQAARLELARFSAEISPTQSRLAWKPNSGTANSTGGP